MRRYIDTVRLRQPMPKNLEVAATRIAEHYGLPMPKTPGGLANTFDATLTKLRSQNGPRYSGKKF
jgi:hypothetical protein